MNLKIYRKQPKEDTFVRLVQTGTDIRLVVCDTTGSMVDGGCILVLTEKGIELQSGMAPKLGFKLDKIGCIACETF